MASMGDPAREQFDALTEYLAAGIDGAAAVFGGVSSVVILGALGPIVAALFRQLPADRRRRHFEEWAALVESAGEIPRGRVN